MKLAIVLCLLFPAGLRAQQLKPETAQSFDCYVQAAEARMDARKAFLLADADTALSEQIVRGQKIRTIEANGANPHKLPGRPALRLDRRLFIPGTTLDRLIPFLQDYDHRAQYFPETISASKLLCVTAPGHFQYSMRMKEPAILDVDSDVCGSVWTRSAGAAAPNPRTSPRSAKITAICAASIPTGGSPKLRRASSWKRRPSR